MIVSIGSSALTLLPSRAVMLEDRTLVVADLHLGKASAFQRHGLRIPEGHSAADLAKLAGLCHRHGAERLVINGDLFHSAAGWTPEIADLLARWLDQLGIPVSLIAGNHDTKLDQIPDSLRAAPSGEHGGFLLIHDPAEAPPDTPAIAAHWHPVARISDGTQRPLRMPCFFLHGSTLVLPSFGEFTGGWPVKADGADRVFVETAGRVVEIPVELVK